MRIKHIDGLRAFAVIAVVLFHALPDIFPNAYIGVDYFLVISGYVISKKYIFTKDKFNFLNFWKRSIRLYPQLIVCILICIHLHFYDVSKFVGEFFSIMRSHYWQLIIFYYLNLRLLGDSK